MGKLWEFSNLPQQGSAALIQRSWMAVALLTLTLAGCARSPANVSGTYLNIAPSEVALLQIVEQTNHAVVGRMQVVSLKPGAEKVSTTDVSVSGVARQGQVVLTLKNADEGFLGGLLKLHVSGTAKGNHIALYGWPDQPGTAVVFVKSDYSTFTARIEQFARIANKTRLDDMRIAALKRQANAYREKVAAYQQHLADVAHLSIALASMTKRMRQSTGELETLPDKYQQVTAKMQQMLTAESTMPRGCCARTDQAYRINGVSYAFNSMHYALGSAEYSWQYSDGHVRVDIAASDISDAQTFCDAEYPGCAHFEATLAAMKVAEHALDNAFAADEAAWSAEQAKQRALLVEATHLASG